MKAIVRSSVDGEDIKVKELPMIEVKNGFLLIKVKASPIHPADRAAAQGKFSVFPPPATIGFEASGVIVDVGEGVDKEEWLNKRVAVCIPPFSADVMMSQGWQQFIQLPVEHPFKIVLPDELSFEDGALFWGNPVTVRGMLELAAQAETKVIVQNAAASSLGQILIKYAAKRGLETVNIVRRPEQVEALNKLGAKYVISTGSEGWQTQLKEVTMKLGPAIMLDAITGEMAGTFLSCLAPNSILYAYGNLSG